MIDQLNHYEQPTEYWWNKMFWIFLKKISPFFSNFLNGFDKKKYLQTIKLENSRMNKSYIFTLKLAQNRLAKKMIYLFFINLKQPSPFYFPRSREYHMVQNISFFFFYYLNIIIVIYHLCIVDNSFLIKKIVVIKFIDDRHWFYT